MSTTNQNYDRGMGNWYIVLYQPQFTRVVGIKGELTHNKDTTYIKSKDGTQTLFEAPSQNVAFKLNMEATGVKPDFFQPEDEPEQPETTEESDQEEDEINDLEEDLWDE